MNIFIGNLSFDATETEIHRLFKSFGKIVNLSLVKEKNGLKSRGFGFVEMANDKDAESAIKSLNGRDFKGRVLEVSVARTTPGEKKIKKGTGYKTGRRTKSYLRRTSKERREDEIKAKSLSNSN